MHESLLHYARTICTIPKNVLIETKKKPRNITLCTHSTYTKDIHTSSLNGACFTRFPQHIAIIMDGNARWASRYQKQALAGHIAGVESLKQIVKCCRKEEHIKALTVFAMSTENQQRRPPQEISFLLSLVERVLHDEIDELFSAGVRLHFIGDQSMLPTSLLCEIEKAVSITQHNCDLHLIVALNYGSRHDMTTAMKNIMLRIKRGEIDEEDITEDLISSSLSLAACVPRFCRHPDLIIRTSGEMRLSNFLLWESAYSELYFSDVLWPDFREEHFLEALEAYAARERRYGDRIGNDRNGDGYS